jgi:hypothetical protein
MSINFANVQTAALSALAALVISTLCVTAAVGPVVPLA